MVVVVVYRMTMAKDFREITMPERLSGERVKNNLLTYNEINTYFYGNEVRPLKSITVEAESSKAVSNVLATQSFDVKCSSSTRAPTDV